MGNEKKKQYIDIRACREGDLSLLIYGFSDASAEIYLYEAVSHGHLNIVKYLVERGLGKINWRILEFLETVSSKGHVDILKYFVEDLKLVFHQIEEVVLRKASAAGHLDIVKYVVEKGSDVNIRQGSPLRSAALEGHYEVVKYLVENGSIISPKAYEFALKNKYYSTAHYLDKHFIYKKLEV